MKAFIQYRKKHNLTQIELASMLGTTPASICRYETGVRKIRHTLVDSFSKKTGIPKSQLRPDIFGRAKPKQWIASYEKI